MPLNRVHKPERKEMRTLRKVTKNEDISDEYSGPTTPEDYENYLISLATKQAEKQLREGTAPAQVVTHYLKMGSVSERLKQDNLRAQMELSLMKAENIRLANAVDVEYQKVIDALTLYSGGSIK